MDEARPPLPRLRARPPFRLGVTSYVYPADILPNAEALAPVVADIELVLFQSEEFCNLPSPDVIERLADLGRRFHLTYTVHFPIDRKIGSADAGERAALVDQIRKIIRLTGPLAPFAYVLHPEGVLRDAAPGEVRRWRRDAGAAVKALLADGTPPDRFCVENLDFPFEWCEPLLDAFGLAVCVDVGHLWRYGADVEEHFRRYFPRTRLVHLHGERAGKDHISLAEVDDARAAIVRHALSDFSGVVTLEVFDYDAASNSILELDRWFANASPACG